VDYLYAAMGPGRHPIGWDPQRPIELRLGDLVDQALEDESVLMAAELTHSIGLTVSVAERLESTFVPLWPDVASAVPRQTIVVEALNLTRLSCITGLHPAALENFCSGHTTTAIDSTGKYYDRAHVAVLMTGTAADQMRALRHHIGHALGLGHCRSTERLMHVTPEASVRALTPVELNALRALHHVQEKDSAPPMCLT
jgi:hypothetical protein